VDDWVRALPDIAGRPTPRILVTLEGATPMYITDAKNGQRVLTCHSDGVAAVVLRLHHFGHHRERGESV